MPTTIYANTKEYGRIPVAEVRGDTMYKTIKEQRWEMRKPPGLAFDESSLAAATKAGAKFICAYCHYRRPNPYWAEIEIVRIPVDRDHGFQRGLGWEDWAASKEEATKKAIAKKMKNKRPEPKQEPQMELL